MIKCTNCGSEIEDNEKFCKVCGTKKSKNIKVETNVVETVESNTKVINDDVLINAYIGKNANKLKYGGFSWLTLFLGMYYVLYRKMWAYGILWFLILFAVALFTKDENSIYDLLAIIINIIMAFFFKDKYMDKVKKEVSKIKNENESLTEEELVKICEKKGGTSIIVVILLIIVYVCVLI